MSVTRAGRAGMLAVAIGIVAVATSGACAREAGRVRGSGEASADAKADAKADADAHEDADAGAREETKKAARLGKLEKESVCGKEVATRGEGRAGAKPFTRASGECAGNFCDVADVAPKGADQCFVATSNITRAERASAGTRGPHAQSTAWDRRAPKYFERVDGHLHLDATEHELLAKNGFVVMDRLGYESYAVAFHDVFQQQLPVYVGVDAIFNAVFQASQTVLGQVEKTRLGPTLAAMIDRLRRTLGASRTRYDADTVDDLDLYLVVAHRLLHPNSHETARAPETEALVTTLVESAKNPEGLARVALFGRTRIIDFSQYQPRGHYANAGYEDGFDVRYPRPNKDGDPTEHISASDYFRSMTWLSRLELNLVSRSCRSSSPGEVDDAAETPREARDAVALADLLGRAGALADLGAFEEVYSVFAGSREDVPLTTVAALAAKGGFGPRDPDAPAKLRAAIGTSFKRTARTHFMPDSATELPAIATMFGTRIVPDIAPLTRLVHPAIAERMEMGAADVGYVLGHDRARAYLAAPLAAHPALGAALDASRAELAAGTRGKKDVYSAWMGAALRLADPPAGTVPSFMRTEAFADMRMSSALAVYAQIRHTFVLLAGQGYDGYGCEIPDGWVEPALASYDGMLAWARAARAAAPSQAAYFRRVEQVLGMLRSIAATELSGAALSEPQRRWLGMVSEYTPKDGYGDSGEPPKYTGWYFDLFPDREIGAQRGVDLVADWFTLTNADQVRYLGVEKAALGVFVVDVGGEARAMVGPVAKTYELASPIASRLDDEAARAATGKSAAWLSFVASRKADPDLAVQLFACDDDARVVVQTGKKLSVTVTLLDHHGDPLAEPQTTSSDASVEPAVLAFRLPKALLTASHGIEGLHLHVDEPSRWDAVTGVSVYGGGGVWAPGQSSYGTDAAFGALATLPGR